MEKYPTDFETVVVEDISRTNDDNATLNKLKSAMSGVSSFHDRSPTYHYSHESPIGVTYVLHTASPYTFKVTNGEEELLKPAKNGTENVLKAANAVGSIKKIVITSSFAAITDLRAGGPWRDYKYTEKGRYSYLVTIPI